MGSRSGNFLTCERRWVFHVLIIAAGIFGAYTYSVRGNVFCNAQTGNVVLMGLALGRGQWGSAVYYLIPISAYVLGAFVSELLPNPVKRNLSIRWDTLLIGIEILAVVGLGFIPLTVPVQVSQVIINFIASMQYNTFRQAEGVPMATTFATNHIRQIGVGLAKLVLHRRGVDSGDLVKLVQHAQMLLCFIIGVVAETVLCGFYSERAIWLALIPLAVILAVFLRADLVIEKDLMERKPGGH